MNTQASYLHKLRYFFYILMAAIFGWFLFMELFGADEQSVNRTSTATLYSGTFVWEKADGTSEEIKVPGKYQVPAGETMVLTTTLPDNYDETAFAIRSSLQDVKFYIGGELRAEYSTKETRLVGKNSASRFVFCPTSYKDAGKELRLELTTYTSNYSGVVNSIYCGDQSAIWQIIFHQYGPTTFIGFFVLFSGMTIILFSMILGFLYHIDFDMEYLGWCMTMGAVWLLGESKLRQILVPNASALASLCFVMIILCPIPLLLYADSIQNGRHRRMYLIAGGIVLANFAISSVLYSTGMKDYIEMLPLGQIILAAVFVMVFVHLFQYLHKSKYHTDRLLLVGLLLIMVCVTIESASVYFVTSVSGIFTGIGMIILLFVNVFRTVRGIQHMEDMRQQQELDRKQKQTEEMTLQMMRTLAATIEGKDRNNCGHSIRVAEYAALIGKRLGLSSEEIENLKDCAYLHDIGAIGIPDQILSKPGRLSEEEYALIKQHTLIGAHILKDITLVPHLVEVTKSHHERYDGTGYPEGLSGVAIPLYARIVAVADSFDAMHSRRIYRNALSEDQIRKEFSESAGKQFDPRISAILLDLMDEGHLEDVTGKYKEMENSLYMGSNHTINKFISDVFTTIKSQEDITSYDFLTGLPLRTLGEKQIACAVQDHSGCLAFVDMDNLKKINDVHGHKAGDRALMTLGKLLARFASNGYACRLGGDEFLLFFPDITHEEASEHITQLFQQFHALTKDDAEIQYASLSAGLYMCSGNEPFPDCSSKADNALYYAKQNGKNQFSFYQPQIDHLSTSVSEAGNNLTQIAKSLQDSGSYMGALNLDYRDFARQYSYIHQLVIRNHCRCYLIMLTMESTGETSPSIEKAEQALLQMEEIIRKSIRKIDICTRYSSMQYLILLFQPLESAIPNIMDRIFMQYESLDCSKEFHPIYDYQAMSEEEHKKY